jgi:hypothetical protein
MERFKNRLLGTSKAKKDKVQAGPALLQTEAGTGLVFKVIRRFRLQEQLKEVLEQAGVKWTPAQLIQRCLLLFLVAFGLAWFFLPPEFRNAASWPVSSVSWCPSPRFTASAPAGFAALRNCFRKAWNLWPAPCAPGTPSRFRSR